MHNMGNNKYQLYAMVILAASLFCVDQWGRQWFVNVATQIFDGGEASARTSNAERSGIIVAEIPKTRFGEKHMPNIQLDAGADVSPPTPVDHDSCDPYDEECFQALSDEVGMAQVGIPGKVGF